MAPHPWPVQGDPASKRFMFKKKACVYIPLSKLRPGARAFGDLKKKHQLTFLQVFLRLAQLIVGERKGKFKWEPQFDNGGGIHGYVWWLFVTSATADDLDTLCSTIVSHHLTMMGMAEEGKPQGMAHRQTFTKRRFKPETELWKFISSHRTWRQIALDYLSGGGVKRISTPDVEKSIASVHFSTRLAFGAYPVQFSDMDYFHDSNFGTEVIWPKPEFVYHVDDQDVTVEYILNATLPHLQVDKTLTGNMLKCILPAVVSAMGSNDDDDDDEMPDAQRQRLDDDDDLSDIEIAADNFEEDNDIEVVAARFLELSKSSSDAKNDLTVSDYETMRRSFQHLTEQNNVNGRDDDSRHLNSVFSLIKPLTSTDAMKHKRKASEHEDDDDGKQVVSDDEYAYASRKRSSDGTFKETMITIGSKHYANRAVRLLIRKYLHSEFNEKRHRGSRRSAYEKALEEHAISTGLWNTEHLRRWIDPTSATLGNTGIYLSFAKRFGAHMEVVFKVNDAHWNVLETFMCSLDALRLEHNMHLHQMLASVTGAKSKSHVKSLVMKLMCPGTYEVISWITPAALAVNTAPDEYGEQHGVFNGVTFFVDELPASAVSDFNGQQSDLGNRLKEMLDQQRLSVKTVLIDKETGARIPIKFDASWIMVLIACTNLRLDQMSHPAKRRFLITARSEQNAPDQRTIAECMFDAHHEKATLKAARSAFTKECQTIQAVHSLLGRMIASGVLEDPSTDIISFFMGALSKSLKSVQGFRDPDPSMVLRLGNFAIGHMKSRVFMDFFLHPGREAKTLTSEDLLKLDRFLFLTTADIVAAIGHVHNEIMPPLDMAVGLALKQYFYNEIRRDEPLRANFKANFMPIERSMNKKDYDPNFVKFDMEKLVKELCKIVPSLMHGFTPSGPSIRVVIENMCNAGPVDAQGYTFHRCGGMIERDSRSRPTKVDMFRKDGINVMMGTARSLVVHASFFSEFIVADKEFNRKYSKLYMDDVSAINWESKATEGANTFDDLVGLFEKTFANSIEKTSRTFESDIEIAIANSKGWPDDHGLDWKQFVEDLTSGDGDADMVDNDADMVDNDATMDDALKIELCLDKFDELERKHLKASFNVKSAEVIKYMVNKWMGQFQVYVDMFGNAPPPPPEYTKIYHEAVKGGANKNDALRTVRAEMLDDLKKPDLKFVREYIVSQQTEAFKKSLGKAMDSGWALSAIEMKTEYPEFNNEVTDVSAWTQEVLAEHINKVCTHKFHLPKTSFMGEKLDQHDEIFEFSYGGPSQSRRMWKGVSKDSKYYDDYSRQTYGSPDTETKYLECDIETLALAERNHKLHITPSPVKESDIRALEDLDDLSVQDAPSGRAVDDEVDGWYNDASDDEEDPGDEKYYFMGLRSEVLSLNRSSEITRAHIKKALKYDTPLRTYDDLRGDLDFDLEDYRIDAHQATGAAEPPRYHWETPEFAKDLDAGALGFKNWSAIPVVRAMQYKLVAPHPSVVQHYLKTWIQYKTQQ